MSDGIKVAGWNDMISYIEGLEITEELENKALKTGGKMFLDEVVDNTPELTGYMKKSWKGSIKRADGDKVYSLRNTSRDVIFGESGSSKNKKYVGFSERAINNVIDDASEAITNVIMEVFK